MKSWQLEKGGRESLHLVDISEPNPGPEQILVRTKAVSLNYRDKLMIEDKYLRPVLFPLVPGSDMADEAVAVGSGVSCFEVEVVPWSTFARGDPRNPWWPTSFGRTRGICLAL